MDPDFIAKTAQIASVLEVSGYPKPGNVHRTQDFSDMVFEDFLISGVVIGNIMKKAAKLGQIHGSNSREMSQIEVGKLIKEAVVETDKWIKNNTNLGIIMLLTPISAAAGMSDEIDELQYSVDEILRATTPQDAVDLYEAINIAEAGGMGVQDDLDVSNDNAKAELIEKNINMFDVLDLSSQWDMLANELTRTMPITFELGYPTFKEVRKDHGINKATVQTFLTILSIYPDTLIARKYGLETAQEVSVDAGLIIKEGGALTDNGMDMLMEFDNDLVKKKLNPGTTADLTASSVMVALLDEYKTNFN
ncbi:triphosphoribosyl-dephospho-CoA protein [Methanobacterium lacus]|uniref:Triphosphoribosyl-dephospho-CoA protein n=1 Tax=Methanobacterium lacus (strain AL-21) TaxID=877455 RepID=F0T5T4_METLA|nr:triphosphoribosyl-dephospho-CoA synthase [Methanobacterium lacus]ADZ09327.1 triphosphoribosyl-dephospho-CoA protein [Methanobacterium lacus]